MAPSGVPLFFTAECYAATYNVEQLRALATTRLGIDEFAGMNADFRIKALLTADKADGRWTGPFRFLDLAPEMRNEIYRELLTIPKSRDGDLEHKRGCHPAILRTSKEVQQEATSILYGDNVREVSIQCTDGYMAGAAPHSTNSLGEDTVRMLPLLAPTMDSTTWKLDKYVSRFEKVTVSLRFCLDPTTRSYWRGEHRGQHFCIETSRCLYHLVVNLASSLKLKTIEVHVHLTGFTNGGRALGPPNDEMLQRALWPLSLLGDSRNIIVTGVSTAIQDYVKANSTHAPVVLEKSLITSANGLLPDLRKLNQRMIVLEHSGQASCQVLLGKLGQLLYFERGYVDEEYIRNMTQGVHNMEALLGSPAAAQLNRKWDEWTSKRQMRSGGQAVKARLRF